MASRGQRDMERFAGLARLAPPGWTIVEKDGVALGATPQDHARLAGVGFDATEDGALEYSELAGRRPLQELRVGGERLVVRRYHHGGLLRPLTGERFSDPTRPFREAGLAARLEAAGIGTPRVVAARARPIGRGAWQLDLVTRRVEDAADVESLLARASRGDLGRAALRALVVAFGEAVGKMHAARFLHADLTPKNALALEVERWLAQSPVGPPRLAFLDLDRSTFQDEPLTDDQRRDNLRRLHRYVARRDARPPSLLSTADRARFLRAAAPGTWREDWRSIAAQHERRAGAHRLGWWLEAKFGGNSGTGWRE